MIVAAASTVQTMGVLLSLTGLWFGLQVFRADVQEFDSAH